jgi:hypothetical protein
VLQFLKPVDTFRSGSNPVEKCRPPERRVSVGVSNRLLAYSMGTSFAGWLYGFGWRNTSPFCAADFEWTSLHRVA